jgi:pimeloyl-ACP methyl ester carboxylesterase
MPGFGSSFDPSPSCIDLISQTGTTFYVSLFHSLFTTLSLTTAHIIGHHSGACLAVELAASYPDFVKSICLVGPTVMSAEERAAMKEVYFKPFNEPVEDGSHLMKTWEYLGNMGIGGDIGLWQREVVDHVRAWRGRNLIYGAVWAQDAERFYMDVRCGILLMCARDDVLWKFFEGVKGMRPEVRAVEVEGGNFELDRDVEGIERGWSEFLEEVEGK